MRRDSLYLRTAELVAALAPFLERRAREVSAYDSAATGAWAAGSRLAVGGTFEPRRGPPYPTRLSGPAYLASASGLHPRSVDRVLRGETEWTGYESIGDPLLCAAGAAGVAGGSALPLYASPFASPERWARAVAEAGVVGDPYRELGARDPWAAGLARSGRVAAGSFLAA